MPAIAEVPKTRERVKLDVDREQVRMLVVDVGCHEAARRLGLNEGTVRQWDVRYKWTADIPRAKPLPVSRVQPVTLVTSPANAQRNVYVEKLLETRGNHLDGALAVSREIKGKSGVELLENIDKVLAAGKHAALVGGWNADSRPDSPGKAFGGRNAGLEIDADLTEVLTEESRDVADY